MKWQQQKTKRNKTPTLESLTTITKSERIRTDNKIQNDKD